MSGHIAIGTRVLSVIDSPFIIAEAGVNCFDIAEDRGISPLEAAQIMVREAWPGLND